MIALERVGVAVGSPIASANIHKIAVLSAAKGAFDDPTILSLLAEILPPDPQLGQGLISSALSCTGDTETLH
jgi:hypothetical protein